MGQKPRTSRESSGPAIEYGPLAVPDSQASVTFDNGQWSGKADSFKRCNGLQPNSNGRQPKSDDLQPNSDGLQPNNDGLQPNSDGTQSVEILQNALRSLDSADSCRVP